MATNSRSRYSTTRSPPPFSTSSLPKTSNTTTFPPTKNDRIKPSDQSKRSNGIFLASSLEPTLPFQSIIGHNYYRKPSLLSICYVPTPTFPPSPYDMVFFANPTTSCPTPSHPVAPSSSCTTLDERLRTTLASSDSILAPLCHATVLIDASSPTPMKFASPTTSYCTPLLSWPPAHHALNSSSPSQTASPLPPKPTTPPIPPLSPTASPFPSDPPSAQDLTTRHDPPVRHALQTDSFRSPRFFGSCPQPQHQDAIFNPQPHTPTPPTPSPQPRPPNPTTRRTRLQRHHAQP